MYTDNNSKSVADLYPAAVICRTHTIHPSVYCTRLQFSTAKSKSERPPTARNDRKMSRDACRTQDTATDAAVVAESASVVGEQSHSIRAGIAFH